MPRSRTIDDATLLRSVLATIARTGPARFTLALAAADAGLAPATLLQRHGSKEALVRAAFAFANDSLAAEIAALTAEARPDPARLLAFLVGMAGGFGSAAAMPAHLQLLAEDLRNPSLEALARRRSELLREAIAALLPAAALPRVEAAWLVEAVWHGAVIQAASAGKDDIAGAVRRRLRACLGLLLGPTPA